MKAIQLIAALPGWFARRETDKYTAGVACWALGDDGRVYPVIAEDGGVVVEEAPCLVFEPHQAYEYKWSDGTPPTDEDWEPILCDGDTDGSVFWRKPHGAT